MTGKTARYGLVYPQGSDYVADTPEIFKQFADTTEAALSQVDDRQTDAAVKPVVRPTLTQLQAATGVTGQTGYVTEDDDPLADGVYHYDGSSWTKDGRSLPITFDRSGLTTSNDQLSIDGIVIARDNGTYFAVLSVRWLNLGAFTTQQWAQTTLAKMVEWTSDHEVYSACMENIQWENLGKNGIQAIGDTINYVSPGSIDIPANSWHSACLAFQVNPKAR